MTDDKLWQRWEEIHQENMKKAKEEMQKPQPAPPLVQCMQQLDVIVPMMIGLQTSPKLSSQQQMKVRKMCDKFADDMFVLCDPTVNEQLAKEIYYNGLKQRMMDKIKDEK
jgi:hypothetical protein